MNLFLSALASFLVTITLMPVIIRVARSIDLLDKPDKRKIHSVSIPSLGGVAIFSGIVFALALSSTLVNLGSEKYFLGGCLLIFLLGVRDDLSSLEAKHKLVIQLFAAALVVFFGGIKIEGLHGLFGVQSFPWYWSEIFTVVVIVIMTNAFNLIDGIDGLAGTIGLIMALFFGVVFMQNNQPVTASIAFATCGAIVGFLLYNWHPSKVFMGDTGSMLLGFLLTISMIKFLQLAGTSGALFNSPIALSLSIFILPVYDTLRVFIIRVFSGKHPLAPDRNHTHHVLLKLGFNHSQSTMLLAATTLLVFSIVSFLQFVGELWLILGMAIVVCTVGALLDRKLSKREAARSAKLTASRVTLTKSA